MGVELKTQPEESLGVDLARSELGGITTEFRYLFAGIAVASIWLAIAAASIWSPISSPITRSACQSPRSSTGSTRPWQPDWF